MLGVHIVTVPLPWPRHSTAFHGFCRITSQGPWHGGGGGGGGDIRARTRSHKPSQHICCFAACHSAAGDAQPHANPSGRTHPVLTCLVRCVATMRPVDVSW